MTPIEEKLKLCAVVKYFNLFNIASYSPKRADGALLQPRRDIRNWLKDKLIAPIILTGASSRITKARHTFYRLTKAGFQVADIDGDLGQIKRLQADGDNTKHRTAKVDIAVSFYRNYPDWNIEIDYQLNVGGKRPDVFIKMERGTERKHFWVEIERKEDPSRTYHKAKGLDKFFDENRHRFKEWGMEYNTQILIVYMHRGYTVFNRTQGIDPKEAKDLKRKFDKLIARCDFHHARFRFMPIYDYARVNEAVWYISDGKQLKLI